MGRFDALTQLDHQEIQPSPAKESPIEIIKKPASPLTHLPENPQTGKPANPHVDMLIYEKVEKYTTRLEPRLIKHIKHYALEHDVKDYEVVQKAVKEYLEKKQ